MRYSFGNNFNIPLDYWRGTRHNTNSYINRTHAMPTPKHLSGFPDALFLAAEALEKHGSLELKFDTRAQAVRFRLLWYSFRQRMVDQAPSMLTPTIKAASAHVSDDGTFNLKTNAWDFIIPQIEAQVPGITTQVPRAPVAQAPQESDEPTEPTEPAEASPLEIYTSADATRSKQTFEDALASMGFKAAGVNAKEDK